MKACVKAKTNYVDVSGEPEVCCLNLDHINPLKFLCKIIVLMSLLSALYFDTFQNCKGRTLTIW